MGGTQVVEGRISIPYDSPLNDLDSQWIEALTSETVKQEIFLEDAAAQVLVDNAQLTAEGYLGDFWGDFDVPETIMASVKMNSGVPYKREAAIAWDSSSYDPMLPTQEITGKLNFVGYADMEDISEAEIPTLTLTITLTRDPNDAVDHIIAVTLVRILGVMGLPLSQQPCPETVRVRIIYESGDSQEVDAFVSWQDNGFNPTLNDGFQTVTGILRFPNNEIPPDTRPCLKNKSCTKSGYRVL